MSEASPGAWGEDASVHDFFDGLDKRLGRQESPICGVDDWHRVLEPVRIATLQGATRADMEVAVAVCRSCRFVRMHLRNSLGDLSVWL
jgi:hypothetical protein